MTEKLQLWHKDGRLHRVDGPAIIFPDGGTQWYQNGRLHRIGGPAIETASGFKMWFEHGVFSSEVGPIQHPTQHWVLSSDGKLT